MALRHLFFALSLLALLAGCSALPTAHHGAALSDHCNIDNVQGALGQSASAKRIEQTRRQAKAQTLRVLAPGDAATLDYDLQRLNIYIDESETIVRLSCG
ncbi:MAG: hypothetical protein KAX70_06305 [Pseudomonas sp.]|nr:hypothetical protein [Pseudomonas sp.]